jgi:3-hydroxymyristoyl/3-hydroxydecanoyl-(acyl carrier protein) dehydratase
MMLATGNELLEFIPQREPVVMIDRLIHCDHEKIITGLKIEPDNIFFHDGFFSESGMVENIAQTAAAGVGYICKLQNKNVSVGFIASIKDLKLFHLPVAGDEIVTEVIVTNQVMQVSIIKGTIFRDGVTMAECEMRIFVKPD